MGCVVYSILFCISSSRSVYNVARAPILFRALRILHSNAKRAPTRYMRGRVRRTHICVGLAIHMYDGQYGGPSHVAAYCLRAAMLIIIASTSTAAVTKDTSDTASIRSGHSASGSGTQSQGGTLRKATLLSRFSSGAVETLSSAMGTGYTSPCSQREEVERNIRCYAPCYSHSCRVFYPSRCPF